MRIAVTRILRLRLAGLTIGAVGADFLCRRITPLQERGRPTWEFKNAADIMRLRPGLNYNFTALGVKSPNIPTGAPRAAAEAIQV